MTIGGDGIKSNAAQDPLRSVHTSSFPDLLAHLGLSLLVSTYQAGRLVILRADEGILNTHFHAFAKPMGMAVEANRLAIGTEWEIAEFHNVPAVAHRVDPPGKCDAVFLPRVCHSTGDVQVHEMAWVDGDVCFVNTRFSCLCTLSTMFSFVPCWRPWFVSRIAADDCCHLNGLCVIDGRVAFVTALGATDEPGGWRKNKRDGGVLIDVAGAQIVSRGLSMPHSPRWYRDRLWLLHSGTGGFGFVDPQTGRYESVLELPGFTRGLAFAGSFAFIGLSQVRETAVFSGIPISERPETERVCGVWVVNIESGEVVAWVRFEDNVQEIFAVEALNFRFPDVINDDRELLAGSFVLSEETLAAAGPCESTPQKS